MIGHASYVICDGCGNPAEVVTGGAREARHVAAKTERYARIDGRDLCGRCRESENGPLPCQACGRPITDSLKHYPWVRCDSPTDLPRSSGDGREDEG